MLKHHKCACAFNLSHKAYDSGSTYACACNNSNACAWELSSLEVLYPNPVHWSVHCKHGSIVIITGFMTIWQSYRQ